MTLPLPGTSNDWQTIYTKGQASRDSQIRSLLFFLPLVLTFLAGVLFAYTRVTLIQKTFSSGVIYTLRALVQSLIAILIYYLVIRMAFKVSRKFLEEFYQPPEDVKPSKVIYYRLVGVPWLPPPINMMVKFKSIVAKDGRLLNQDAWPAWMSENLGGPVMLVVFDGTALYVERGNSFSRIVGPGKGVPFLEPHETVKYVVDYRPTIKTEEKSVWTKDGIKLKVTLRLECQIGAPRNAVPENDDPKSGKLVYRYDAQAIKKAVEWNSVLRPSPEKPPVETDWTENAWVQAMSVVQNFIGSHVLDDLIPAERNKGRMLLAESVDELLGKVNVSTNKHGVYVTSLQISQISYPPEVEEQRRLFWEAERQGVATVIDGQSKASSIRLREKARAEAQKDLILAVADGLERNESKNYVEPLILTLSRILDESLQNPQMRAYLADETMDTLKKLQKLIQIPSDLKGNAKNP
jgi:regulator of protease activity HflC (stomatin/prohibitin superfamily)